MPGCQSREHMGEKTSREYKLILKGDSDTLDEFEELLREKLAEATDNGVKSDLDLSNEEEIEEDDEENLEDDDDES